MSPGAPPGGSTVSAAVSLHRHYHRRRRLIYERPTEILNAEFIAATGGARALKRRTNTCGRSSFQDPRAPRSDSHHFYYLLTDSIRNYSFVYETGATHVLNDVQIHPLLN